MYFIQHTAFLILLLHQCIVSGFNIFDMGLKLNYLRREIKSITTSDLSDLETKRILQELDHFNSSDKRMWQMKYMERLKYWKENGPIYIFLYYFESNFWLESGIMKELAEETHGAMYSMDHRYYGDNRPFINVDTKNIKYLNSRQALADVAKLINYLKSLPMYKDSKVVIIGGTGYNGNLAAWMKVLYPELVDAVISSSAPVLAQKDFSEFLEKVKDNIEHYGGTECLNKVTNMFADYYLLLQSPEGVKQLKKDENICDSCDMTNVENQQFFFFYKTMFVSYTGGNPFLINMFCKQVGDKKDYISFLNKYSKIYNSDLSCECYNFQDEINFIKDRRNLDHIYTYMYQGCTEFGHFKTTSSKKQPFLNIPLQFHIKVCSALFDNNFNEKRVDEGVEITNKLYGGLKPNVTKVIFTNGDRDEFSVLSVLKDLSGDVKALVIPGASHSEDLYISKNKELEEARRIVKYLIRKWIGAYV